MLLIQEAEGRFGRLTRRKQRRGVQRPWTLGIFPPYNPLPISENFYVGFKSPCEASHRVGKQPRALGVKEEKPTV